MIDDTNGVLPLAINEFAVLRGIEHWPGYLIKDGIAVSCVRTPLLSSFSYHNFRL